MPKLNIVEAQLTLSDGQVIDLKTSLGDSLELLEVSTVYGDKRSRPIKYYSLIATPCVGTEG